MRESYVYVPSALVVLDLVLPGDPRGPQVDTLGIYTRVENAWTDNAATQLGL